MIIRPANPPRPDWFRIIVDLERAGVSHESIGRYCGRTKRWAAALKYEIHRDPRYPDGVSLLELWAKSTGRAVTDVPCRPLG